MGFINDRFTVSANWILNPDVFWKGNNLVEYVNSSSGDTTEWTIPDFSTHPKYGELIHKLSNNSPQNLWQLLSDCHFKRSRFCSLFFSKIRSFFFS